VFERTRPIRDPVELTIDGRTVRAERGEPIAVALVAAGETTIARSPKLHRPRGPACLRGDCDGCLARVDGVPNVMTCTRDVAGGERVSGQNVLGSRKTDLLRLTDWFFPHGIDHHHLMAGVPGVQDVMQTVARQMAGIGRLPDAPEPARAGRRLPCDVLVVGGGLAGAACAAALLEIGADVALVDDGGALGGAAAFAGPDAAPLVEAAVRGARGAARARTTAAGVYEREVLVAGPFGAELAAPRALVVATGAHDGTLVVPGGDLPGVFGARAICALAARGIFPADGAVIVGGGAWADRVEAALGARVRARVAEADLEAVVGRSRAEGVRVRRGKKVAAAVVAVATPLAPAFEIAAQAGAAVRRTPSGYAVVADERGRAGGALWAVGECTGAPFDPAALVEAARRAARDIGRYPSSTSSKSPSPPTTNTKPKSPKSEK
jgi:sarcosine oxidase subunit alpha